VSKVFTGLNLTGGLVTRHQSDDSLVESWGEDIVPLLLGERMRFLLLSTLLFEVSWVLSSCH